MSKIDEILDNYAQQYFQLLRMPSIEAKNIKDRKRAEAKQAIKQLINEARIEELQWVHPMPLELRSTIAIEKRIAELKRE